MRIELVPLVINSVILVYYVIKHQEPGKTLYWLGATILTIGLLKMRG